MPLSENVEKTIAKAKIMISNFSWVERIAEERSIYGSF